MSESKMELQIPSEILERARQIANEKDQSVESVLLDGLSLLFGQLPDTSIMVEREPMTRTKLVPMRQWRMSLRDTKDKGQTTL